MGKEAKCQWCGKRILWIPGLEGKQIPVEAALAPYHRMPPEIAPIIMFTGQGGRIPCEILSEERAGEADGFAHKYHACLKKPAKQQKMTWREKRKIEYGF